MVGKNMRSTKLQHPNKKQAVVWNPAIRIGPADHIDFKHSTVVYGMAGHELQDRLGPS